MGRVTVAIVPTTDDLLGAVGNALSAARSPQFTKAADFSATDVLKVTFKRRSDGGSEVGIELEGGFEKFLAAAIAEQQ